MSTAAATILAPVSNDAGRIIQIEHPYRALVEFTGACPFLFHRWSIEGVEAKGKAAKGSKAKKTDDLESYVYRNEEGLLSIPSEYFRQSAIGASKFKQDPRSPRKSAMDLFKAGVICLTEYCSLGVKDWEFVDRRRVQVQRNAITRSRPAMTAGWKATAEFQVLLPEYIGPDLLNETLNFGGRLIGVGDNRPSYGRFQLTRFEVLDD